MFCVTFTVSEAVQPLAGLVTVSVYRPGALTEGVADVEEKPLGPLQLKVAPGVEDEPLSVTEVTLQVSSLSGPASALGGVMFCVTFTVSLAVQPLAGSVTVSVYKPGALTEGVAEVEEKPPGPLQLKVAPGVVEEPLSVTEVVVQVRVLSAPASTLGAVMFCATFTVSLAVQPLAGLVTVNV
jgi:hypothetical protein